MGHVKEETSEKKQSYALGMLLFSLLLALIAVAFLHLGSINTQAHHTGGYEHKAVEVHGEKK